MRTLLRLFAVVAVFLLWGEGGSFERVEASNPLRLQWPVVMPYASGSFDGVNGPHTGIDIITKSIPQDYTLVAAAPGKVHAVKFDSVSGNVVKIEHVGFDGGTYYTWYGHLSETVVLEDQQIVAGQKIGTMGCTGTCYGTHLHFQVMLNSSVMTGLPCLACLEPCKYLLGKVEGTYGDCGIDDDPPGIKSLVQSEFTVERTNPSLSEEAWFSTELKNTGEVPVYLKTVFLRLKRGNAEVNVYGLQSHQGTLTLVPGESKLFDLRAPPLTEPGLWRIDKVEAEDASGHWFELGGIGSHLMVGYQNLIKDHYAVASSEQPGSGNGPQKANDGNMRSRWESKRSDSQWIEFDLDSTQIVDTVIVRSEAAFPLWFDVLIQEEGKSEWILVVEDLRGLPENSTYISFSPHSARKIKFEFKERGTDWGHSIREIEVYNTSGNPIGGPMPTSTPGPSCRSLSCDPIPNTPTPVPTSTPIPTVTTEPTNIPDTTPPEGYITSPVDGEFLGTGWFNATAYATDSGSGVKKVEFHFWHDGAWYIIEDRNGDDGWSVSFDLTGLWAQNDMKMLLHLEDNADNRIQSNVVSGLTNVLVMATSTATATPTLRSTPTATWTATLQPTNTKTPTATHTPTPLVTDPMSGVIAGTIVDEEGAFVRGVDVQLWRDTQPDVMYWSQWIEIGTYRFYGLPYSIWTVIVFNPIDNEYWQPVEPQIVRIDAQNLVHEVNFALVHTKTPVPTSTPTASPTPTVVWTNTATPISVPTLMATGTPVPASTLTPTPTVTSIPTATYTPTPTAIPLVVDPLSGVIEGRIVDKNGTSVRGVDVQLWRDTQTSAFWIVWVEDGTYRFDGLPYSTWTLHVEEVSSNDLWETVEPQVVVINKSQKEQTVNFVLTKKQSPVFKVFAPLVRR